VRKFRRSGLAAVIVVVSLVVVVSAFGSAKQQQKTIVAIRAGVPVELSFTPRTKTVLKGARPLTVAFVVTNRGLLKHDFKIAGAKTLLIAPGKNRTLVVTFAKTGRYQYICTVRGHALGGMKGTLTVKRS
jgi:uncharacterized cupredoxin-like copper-binding protein